MSGYKGALIGAGAIVLLAGGLFGAGVLKVGGRSADPDHSDDADD